MASLMLQDMGISGISTLGNYMMDREAYKLQQMLRRHQETMAALSVAQSENQLSRNEVAIRDQVLLSEAADQITLMEEQEAARASAATAGVSGNSVSTSLGDLARARAQRKYARERSAKEALVGVNDTRRQVHLQAAYGTPISVLQRPSVGTAMLGLGTSLLDIYKQHTPGSDNPNVR